MPDHEVIITGSTEDLDRNWKRIRFECPVPGCASGMVAGSPAATMDAIVAVLSANHGGAVPDGE